LRVGPEIDLIACEKDRRVGKDKELEIEEDGGPAQQKYEGPIYLSPNGVPYEWLMCRHP
jgi:hypothetical protein